MLRGACRIEATNDYDLNWKSNTMCNTKEEIISLRLDVKVIFSLQGRNMCIA